MGRIAVLGRAASAQVVFTPVPTLAFARGRVFRRRGGRGVFLGMSFDRLRTNGVFTPIPAFPRRGGRGICPHPEGEGTLAHVCIRGGRVFSCWEGEGGVQTECA